jgi:prepilin-type N-terminal cleavage/methylation domain-containing protein
MSHRSRKSGIAKLKSPFLRRASGFSLVELMLVMSIMLLLAAIAIPRLLDAQKKAYEAGVVTFLRTLQSTQESYRLANGSYADNFTDLNILAFAPPAPGEPRGQEDWARLIEPLAQFASTSVYAAQGSQQPPAKTPPPDTGQQGSFGSKATRSTRKSGGAGGAPNVGGSGSTGGAAPGGAGAGGPGVGRPRKGAGSGASLGGGTPLGGGSGAPAPSGSTAPQTGGSGGSFSPSSGPGTKSNVLLKHNYIFRLQRPTPTTWTCTAAPVRDRGQSKFFFFDQSGVIRVELGKFAGSTSPQL